MKYFDKVGSDITSNAQSIFDSFASVLPGVISAIIVILVGYFIAVTLKRVVTGLANKLKVNSLVSKTSIDEHLEDAGVKMNLAEFLGNVAKWIILIISLLVVVNIFDLDAIEGFIEKILGIFWKLIIALVVFGIAVYVARFTNSIAVAIAKYIKVKNTDLVATITSGVIYLTALLTILEIFEVNVIMDLITTIIQAAVYGIVIALGLAFGLGGQERAKEVIEKMKK